MFLICKIGGGLCNMFLSKVHGINSLSVVHISHSIMHVH